MHNYEFKDDQNANAYEDERVVLANLITHLKLVIDENKKIQKQLRNANISLTHELDECKSALKECKSSLKDSNGTQDRCIIALYDHEIELAKYKDLMNVHLPSFENPTYFKKGQSEKPCLYEIPYDKDDLVNIFAPDREETLTLEQKSRSKLNKDKVKPYDYTKQNNLYEVLKPPTQKDLDQLWETPFASNQKSTSGSISNKVFILERERLESRERKREEED
ncbi:hypothetical protein Tco_0715396 [Tanacetum coccineum]